MLVLAPAKINLHLRVGAPRADGFHPVFTWMVTVGLFDKLIVDRSPRSGAHLSCDHPELSGSTDASNLVVRAANAFAQALYAGQTGEAAQSVPGVDIRLLKHIPIGAGLGGGSSDGARILQALNLLWAAGWSNRQLADLSAQLGSDLPFFFLGPSAICLGRGELVHPHPPPQPRLALLFFPGIHMPTPAVYKTFDRLQMGQPEAVTPPPDFEQWAHLPASQLLTLLQNDLEAPAFAMEPNLGRLRNDLEQTVARVVRMSGSGSTLFTLFDTQDEASAAAGQINRRFSAVKTALVQLAPHLEDDLNKAGADR